MKRKPRTRRQISPTQRVARRIGLGAGIGMIAGCLQVCIPFTRKPPPPWLILTVYTLIFALIAAVAGRWLRNQAADDAPHRPADSTGWFGWLVSFSFGAVFGLCLGIIVAIRLPGFGNPAVLWCVFITCVGGCGLLAAKYGNDFWEWWSE